MANGHRRVRARSSAARPRGASDLKCSPVQAQAKAGCGRLELQTRPTAWSSG